MDRVSHPITQSICCLTRPPRRLKEYKDTVGLFIFTLDLVTNNYPLITAVDGLPYDCLSLTPCSTAIGGVVILASNAIIFVDQASRRVILPVNGWPPRTSDLTMPSLTPQEQLRNLQLEGARFTFVDDKTLFVILKDGTVHPVELVLDGKTVSRLSMADALARTTIPAVVARVRDDYLFVGSMVGPSVLLRTAHVEEVIKEEDVDMDAGPATVVAPADTMDLDDDDGESIQARSSKQLSEPCFQISTAPLVMGNSLRQTGLLTALSIP